MNTPDPDDIFDLFQHPNPTAGSGAERIRKAVLQPGSDSEADGELLRFRKLHLDLLQAPKIRDLVKSFRKPIVSDATTTDSLETREAPRPTWRDQLDRLIAHCRDELRADRTATGTDAPEQVVSTILSSFLRLDEAGQFGDLHDPEQLWPVLLAIAGRKLKKKKLTEALIGDARFGAALGAILAETFSDFARDDRRCAILAHRLFGRSNRQIGKLVGEGDRDVANVVRTLHADLHLRLIA